MKKPCLISDRSRDTHGYPQVWDAAAKTTRLQSRVVLEKKLGRPIKPGMYACHRCDVPACIEPTHLYEGTPKQNARDRMRRGRDGAHKRTGEGNGRAVLTKADVLAIRASDKRHVELAAQYGVTAPMIRHIRMRRSWRHV